MRKIKLFLTLLMLMCIGVTQMWGAEEVYKTATFSAANCTKNSTYTGSVTCTVGTDSWTAAYAANNNGGWDYIKMGGKRPSGGGSTVHTGTIITSAKYSDAITKVVVNGTLDRGSVSAKLIYASNSDFTSDKVESDALTEFTDGKMTFTIESPVADRYYKLELVCTNGTTTNGVITITSVEYYKQSAAPSCTNEITITKADDPANGTFAIDNSGTVCIDGGNATVNVTATPNDGYHLATVSSTVGTVGDIDGNACQITGISANTTISVTFEADPAYTVSFNVGGSTASQADITEASAGAGITLPAGPTPTCSAAGWEFAGWAAAAVGTQTETAPTLLSGTYHPTSNTTLYAVYSKSEGGGSSEIQYVQVTSLALVNAGGEFIITNGSKYLPSTTTSSSVAQANMVTVTDGVVTGTVVDAMKWTISAADGDGYVTVKNADEKYLYATNSNSGLRVGDTEDTWKFEEYTVSEVLGFAMQEKSNSRWCAVYTDGSDWRPYGSKNHTNYKTNSGRLDLYKATEISSSTTYYASIPDCTTPSCEKLGTPVVSVPAEYLTYNSAKLTWAAIANANKYLVKFNGEDQEATSNLYFDASNLDAETQYTYQVKALAAANQDDYCDGDFSASANFTTLAAPAVVVDPASWDFEAVATDAAVSKVFSVSGTNLLAGDLTITVPSGYSVSPESITMDAAGNLDATEVTVSKNTTTAGTYEGNLTISGCGLASAVEVALSMEVKAKYTVTWNNNGSTSTSQVLDGVKPTFPVTPESCDDASTTFIGWATAAWTGKKAANEVEATIYTSADAMPAVSADVTYYAVFAKAGEATSVTHTLTIAGKTTDSNYGSHSEIDDKGATWSGVYNFGDATHIGLNKKADNHYLGSPLFASNVTSVKATIKNGSSSSRSAYLRSENETAQPSSGDLGSVSVPANDEKELTFTLGETAFKQFYVYVSDPLQFHEFVVTLEGAPSYSDYMTTCCTKRAITIDSEIENGSVSADLASACEGTTVTLTFTPATHYHLSAWTLNGTAQDIADNTFEMPAAAVTVSATFAEDACANLAAPTLDEITKTYNSATIAWKEVTDAEEYAVSVVNHATSASVFAGNVDALSKALADLEPETQYDYSIMAVGDGTIKCAADNGVLEGNFITSALPEVKLTLMVGGVEDTDLSGNHAILTPFNLPSTASVTDCPKVFVGWSADADRTTAPEYAPGAEMTFAANASDLTLYAVFADVVTPGVTTWDEIQAVPTAGEYAICSDTYFMQASVASSRFENAEATPSITDGKLDEAPAANCIWEISINADEKFLIKNGENYAAGTGSNNQGKLVTDATDTKSQWTIAYSDGFVIENVGQKAGGKNSVLRNNGNYGWGCYASSTGSGPRLFKKNTSAAVYGNYSTTCAATVADPVIAPAAGTYNEAQEITITCETEGATIYYTTDGNDPTNSSAVYDAENKPTVSESATVKAIAIKGELASEVVSAAYTFQVATPTISGATSFLGKATVTLNCATAGATIQYSIDGTDPSITYSEPFDLEETATVKAIAVKENWTNSAVAEQAFTKVVPMTVAQARDIIDNGTTEQKTGAYVTGIISQVESYNSTYQSITYWISEDGTSTYALKVYGGLGIGGAGFSGEDDVTVGDSVVVKGDLLLYNSLVYELNLNNQLVSYVAKELSGIAVNTAPTKVIYKEDDHFDPTGLVITASYTVGQPQDIAYENNESDFSFAPALTDALVASNEAVVVTITYGGKTATQEITVNAKQNYIVTITEPVNGTVVVKNGDVAIASGDEILEGTTLTIYATADDDYAVDKIYVNGEEIEGNTFVLSAATTVNVTFDVYATHTAEWIANGVSVKTQEAATGTTLVFPTEVTPCTDMVLVGWLTDELENASATEPEGLITETAGLKMPKDGITYYAVFATASAAAEPWVLTSSDITKIGSGTSYADYNGERTKEEITFTTSNVMVGNGDNAGKIQLKASAGIIYNSTAFDADIVSIEVSGVDLAVYEGSAAITSTPASGKITASSSDPYTYTFSAGKRYFHIKKATSGAGYASSITVNLASTVSYSNYVTSCPSCTKVVTFAKEGEDEDNTFELQVNSVAVTSVETCDAAVDVNVEVTKHAENYILSNVAVSGVEGATYNAGVISIPKDAEGELTITATFVENVPVTNISIKETTSIEIGATETLTVTFDPENATNKNVTWESSDENIATVENGVVTAVAEGTATITCKWAGDATIKDECVVTVTEHVVTPGVYEVLLSNALWNVTTGQQETTLNSMSGESNDISFTTTKGSSAMYANAEQTRFYGNGTSNATLTISVPSGYVIKSIAFAEPSSQTRWDGSISANVGTYTADNKSWAGRANSVTFTFGAQNRIATATVTYAAIAPEVTVEPNSLSFTAKQNIDVEGKTFTLTGANLEESDLELAASEGFSVSPVAITAADAMAEGGVEVTVTPDTPTEATSPVEGTVTISGGGLASNVVVNLSMTVAETYAVAVAVNDNTMGSATINGGTATIYVTEDDEIALVATANPGYEFVNWTVSDDDIAVDVEDAASTTALAFVAGTITANFQAQACTGLAAPTLNEVTKTYSSATIAWNAVTKDANNDDIDTEKLLGYVVNIKKGTEVVGTQDDITDATSYALSNLEANTTYSYSIMAMGDGTTYCEENNPLLEGNFTTNDYPAATLTLSEVGAENDYTWGSGLKLNSEIALPSSLQHSEGCSGKVLVGWSSVAIAEPGNEPTANYWEAGADYTMLSENDKLYAVYATATPGTPCYSLSNAAPANSDKVIIARLVSEKYYALENAAANSVATTELTVSAGVVSEPTDDVIWDVESATYGVYLRPTGETSSLHLNNSALKVAGGDTNGDLVFSANGNGSFKVARAANDRWISASGTNGVTYTSSEASAVELYVFKYGAGAASYSGYTTACEAAVPQPTAVATPESVEATAAAVAETTIAIAYENVNLSGVTMNLYNNAACTEAYEGEWLTASLDDDKQVVYSIAENTSYNNAREAYIKVVAPQTDNLADPAVVIIPVSQAKKAAVFASLEDLVAADVAANTNVTVSFENVVIKEIYMYNSNRRGLVFDIQKDEADIKIYFNADVPAAWVAGGKVSGTLTNCPWKIYSNAWQLAPANGWAWNNLEYTAPAAVATVEITGGEPQKNYVDGEKFNPAGLNVRVTYTDESTEDNPVGVTFSEATLAENQTSVEITATYNNVTSAAYTVEGLTVTAIPVKSIAEFIAAGGTRCYLEGIVSNYTNTTKGYFDLTDASGTIYIYGCTSPSSFEEGDKIKVLAEVYELYNSKSEAKNVVYVETLPQAVESVTLDVTEKTIFVGDNFTLTATITPAKATIKNVTWSTSDEAIATVEDGVVTAIAAGEATITVTTEDGGKTATCAVTVSEALRNTLTLMVNGGVYRSIKDLENASVWEILATVTDPDIAGYNFKGWSETEAGEVLTSATAGELSSDMTLYAVYTKGDFEYVKVTETAQITDGQYLIVYETGNVAFNSSLETLDAINNTIAVSITNNTIAGTVATTMAEFTINATAKTIQTKSGKYIGRTANSNGLDVNASELTHKSLAIDGGNFVATASGNPTLRYNKSSNQARFRYYGSGQEAIQLYKRADGAESEPVSATTVTVEDKEEINVSDVAADGVPVSIVVEEGGTLTIDEDVNLGDLTVKENSKVEGNNQLSVQTFTISTNVGDNASGEVEVPSIVDADIYQIDVRLISKTAWANGQRPSGRWHSFTVPFPVDPINGVYDTLDNKLTNEVNYAIMKYHGDIRANGQYGWKKEHNTLVPGTFYLITVDGDQPVIRFKKTATGSAVAENSIEMPYYTGSGDVDNDHGWNGVGNPNMFSGYTGFDVQILTGDGSAFATVAATDHVKFAVGVPFFIQVGDYQILILAVNVPSSVAARTRTEELKNVKITFGNEAYTDKLYVTASEDALNQYEKGKDLVKMTMSGAPKVAQIFGKAYGYNLSMVNTPLVNNNASCDLRLYAPNAGEYTIAAPEMENADIYLTYNGSIIWNLSQGAYTNDFAKGNNEGYGLILVKKAPQVTTGVDAVTSDGLQVTDVQKVIINDHVYILRDEQMYDVTGKAVK